ncbi:unnamed protein product [Caenorhabditis auriculariae]|uniref:Uncharacterized protein n=1 Tax=Caenorhabditis auriculariae TaxID=2777116 RepID=A0A8S1H7B7_9PELO|nr:unnamed protein product [Caenorhabditis auriculariae]
MAVHRKDVLKLLESLQQKEKEMENVRSEMSVLQGRLDVCSANLATLEEEVAWVNATFEKWFQAPVEAKEHEEKSPKDRKKKSVTLVEPETVQKKRTATNQRMFRSVIRVGAPTTSILTANLPLPTLGNREKPPVRICARLHLRSSRDALLLIFLLF